jgi:TRAP-type C4-dicarboxylate transport system permease large subunit
MVNLCIGMVTPPLGLTLFVACNISRQTIPNMLRPLAPRLISMIAVLFLITYVSSTVMYLPNLFR